MRKKSPNQIRIEFTHDVIKFKETHKLKLPPGITYHQHQFQVKHISQQLPDHMRRGVTYVARKSQVGVPHRDLIVLQYNHGIKLNQSRYQELGLKQQKEYVLENTVVFSTSLESTSLESMCSP
jgi:hypothetical protein